MPRSRSLVLLAALTCAGTAFAAAWSSFSEAFPAAPCSDGWAGCVVANASVNAAPQHDAAGRPLPADARLGWFDLEPTAAFSPFVSLSVYAPGGAPVAAPVAAPVEVPPVPAPVEAPPAQAASAAAPVAPTPVPSAPVAVTPSPAPTPSATVPARPSTPAVVTQPTAPAAPTAAATPPTPVRPPPAAAVVAPPPQVVAPAVVTPPAAVAVANTANVTSDDCTDLVKLEPAAMMGSLRVGQVKCLDGRVNTESAQTSRDKLSRLLIVNAEASGNKSEWEKYVRRHLEDIDRSDPDLCFKYASHLAKGGARSASATIKWSEYALDNKARWTGNTFKTRVYSLYKIRAEAATKLWTDAEQTYTQNRTDENEQRSDKLRGQAKDFAREWLDYARVSGQDTKNAMALCASAAGNDTFCRGG